MMPLNSDVSTALQLMEGIQQSLQSCDDARLEAQANADINLIISVLENPIFRGIVTIQDSLGELNGQIQAHPSILPGDFDLTPIGKLVLNLPPGSPGTLYNKGNFDGRSFEPDDQRVPVAKLSLSSSSGGDGSSPQVASPNLMSLNEPQAPFTTPTYALEFQKAIDASSLGREVHTVQLYKPEGSSLGFSVVGLRSEDCGELGIYVQEIQPAGITGRDGRLQEGDQILAIDGQPLDAEISHQQAISILQQARGLVELVIARQKQTEVSISNQAAATTAVQPTELTTSPLVARSPSSTSDTSKAGSDMVLNTEWAQVEVIDLVNDGSGLGFGIIGGRSTGVVVKTILPGGVADRDARLQSGDHILQIGEVNLRGMGSEQVAAVLRQSGSHVRLVVARPVEPTSPDYQALASHAPIVPTKVLGDAEELDRHLLQNGYGKALSSTTVPLPPLPSASDLEFDPSIYIYAQQDTEIELHPQPGSVVDVVSGHLPPEISVGLLGTQVVATDLPEMDTFDVELCKDSHGLGITIAGYVCEKEELSGIFVKSISEGSAADLCQRIQVNDRIVEVDGQSLQGFNNHQAVEVLRATGQNVRLRLERYLRGPKFEQLQQAIANSEMKPPTPSSPSITSLAHIPISNDGDTEVEAEGESRTTIDSLVLLESGIDLDLSGNPLEATNPLVALTNVDYLIDQNFDGELSPATEDALQAKWAQITGPDTEIVVAQLSKQIEGGGLGISLEGTVDVEDGQEVRPHHYIRSILPDGPVGRNGRLRSGDELLEVNGHRLLGLNHVEVVAILKDLPLHVRMVCARKPGEVAARLIDTSQDRAAFAARNILGGSLQNLIPASDRLVKAKSDGSLASSATAGTESSFSRMKSRSLEPLTGLAMWSSEPQVIELVKGDRGLGFSILDYQDPMNPSETVIVIRSLVPGGVAQQDGRLIPGDRLLFVNNTSLENASLDRAVQALKGAQRGIVRIGVAKPLPLPDSAASASSPSQVAEYLSSVDDESCDEIASPDAEDVPGISQTESAMTFDATICSGTEGASLDLLDTPNTEDTQMIRSPPQLSHKVVPDQKEHKTSPHKLPDNIVPDAYTAKTSNQLPDIAITVRTSPQLPKTYIPDVKTMHVDGRGDCSTMETGFTTIAPCNPALSTDVSPHRIEVSPSHPDKLEATLRNAASPMEEIKTSPLLPPMNLELDKVNVVTFMPAVSTPATVTPPSEFSSTAHTSSCEAITTFPDLTVSFTEAQVASRLSKAVVPSSLSGIASRQISISTTDALRSRSVSPPVPADSVVKVCSVQQSKTSSSEDNKAFVTVINVSDVPYTHSQTVTLVTSPSSESRGHTRPSRESTHISPRCISRTELFIGIDRSNVHHTPSSPVQHSDLTSQHRRSTDPDTMTVTQVKGSNVTTTAPGQQQTMLKHWGPERLVEVLREPNCSLGISIVGGRVDLYNAGSDSGSAISGIFIKNVLLQSPAGRTGELKTGDRILEVDSINLRNASHERAVEVIRAAGNPVQFLVQSLIQWGLDSTEANSTSTTPTDSRSESATGFSKSLPPYVPLSATPAPEIIQEGVIDLQQQVQSPDLPVSSPQSNTPPSTPLISPSASCKERNTEKVGYSSGSEDEESDEDNRDLEGRILTKKGFEISRASAGNVKRSSAEVAADPEEEDDYGYTPNKVKKKYGALKGSIQIATLERGSNGLGVSLAGHKDRTRMAVFVCGLNPSGSAYREGSLRVGDEILEVNGMVLQGRCHLNASAIIKGLAGPVFKVIVLRRDSGLQELAVKPITQFPVSLDDETVEERYSKFQGLKTVTIKKGNQGLGIMIIEGKHAEVGQGIFISDLQEGSAAEQAGLCVGEMILQVNKDSILGQSYDAAAQLLKKTEGVVTLVVCNPNKKDPAAPTCANSSDPPSDPKTCKTPEPDKPRIHSKSSVNLVATVNSLSHTKPSHLPVASISPSASLVFSPLRSTATTPGSVMTPSTPALMSPRPKSPVVRTEEPPADPATCPITPGKEIIIEVNKDKMGLGLSIVGGSDTLLSAIIIHEVYPDGAAAKDGRLRPGDQILEVNSEDFRSITHNKALGVLRQTPVKVKMVVLREEASKEEDRYDALDVELVKKPGKGLGLSIVGRKNGTGVFISDVVHGGTAEADGRLMKGDQILSVNGQDLKSASQEEAAAVLKTVAGKVNMKLGRLKAARKGGAANGTEKLEPEEPPLDRLTPPMIPPPLPGEPMLSSTLACREVRLARGPDGLGFSIVGGHGSLHGDLPIYVKTVFDSGAAGSSGALRRGDQIIAVDGISLEGFSHQDAVALLKNASGPVVTLTIKP